MPSDFDADNGRAARQNVERSTEGVSHDKGAASERDSSSSYSSSLLGDSRLAGRGNAPVHNALMQNMQKTQGNRAVQRYVQRSAATTPVQRIISTNGSGFEDNIVAQGGGNFTDDIVAQGGGNIVAQGGGNFDDIVAQGGGNIDEMGW